MTLGPLMLDVAGTELTDDDRRRRWTCRVDHAAADREVHL